MGVVLFKVFFFYFVALFSFICLVLSGDFFGLLFFGGLFLRLLQ